MMKRQSSDPDTGSGHKRHQKAVTDRVMGQVHDSQSSASSNVTQNITVLSENLFASKKQDDLTIAVELSDEDLLRWTNEIFLAMKDEEGIPDGSAEVAVIQPAVGKILARGLAAANACADGIFLNKGIRLPKVTSSDSPKQNHFAAQVYFPLTGIPDWCIFLSEVEATHPNCVNCSKPSLPIGDSPLHILFSVVLPDEVKKFILEQAASMKSEGPTGPIKHPDSVIQASAYLLYCMLRAFPHLSDADKRVVFGDELCAYTMVLTHKACILIKISWDQFHQSGRFAMRWSRVLKGREMAETIARYIWWAKCLLVRALPYKTALTSAPQYTWMPLSEYALRFPNEIGGENTGKTITSHQSLTNPVLRVGERIYRMFNHYLCNTNGSQVLSLFRELRANDEKRGRELEKRGRELATKRAELAEKRAELAEKRTELAERRAELEKNGGGTLMLAAEEKSIVDESSAIKDIFAELVVKASELARNTADIEAELSHVKNEIKQLDVPPPYTNPLIDWVFRAPFISMPFYGPTLHDVLKDTTATPQLVKSLFQSLMKSSLLALENASFAHMDIRTTNICLRDSPMTWDNAILIDFDFCVDYSNAGRNRMQPAIAQYPPEIQAHAKSDVWMLGYLLLRLGMCGSGWEDLTQKQIEDWIGEKVARQEKSEDDGTRGKFVGALHLAEKCLKVDPGSRISISEIAQHVDTWEV